MDIDKDIIENPDKYAKRNKRAIIAFYAVYIVISAMIFTRAADEISKPYGRVDSGIEVFQFIIITLVWALGYVLGTCAIAYTVKNLRDSITQKNSGKKADDNADEIHTGFRVVSMTLYALSFAILSVGLIMFFILFSLKENVITLEAAEIFKNVMDVGTAACAVLMFVNEVFTVIVKKSRSLLFGLSFALSSSALYFFLAVHSIITQMYGNDNLRIVAALVAGFIVTIGNVLYAKKPDILRLPKSFVKD